MTHADISLDVRMLPPQIRRIVRAIGIAQAFVLLRWRGGRRLKLPRDGARSELAAIIGTAALEALVAEFGAQEILTLPKVDKMILQLRDRQMHVEHAGGSSVPQLAGLYGLTTRHVLNILGARRASARDLDHEAKQLSLL
ncbi:MAG: hypothetical protein KGL35_08880 [Bradyrhizobium sp.]|nr:hypothetical protein [Bradyrhizobium sp.]